MEMCVAVVGDLRRMRCVVLAIETGGTATRVGGVRGAGNVFKSNSIMFSHYYCYYHSVLYVFIDVGNRLTGALI